MRIMILISSTLLVAFAQTVSLPQPRSVPETLPQYQNSSTQSGDGIHMSSRAYIRVTPIEWVSQRRTALDSLRAQVARAKMEALKLQTRDPLLREQLSNQNRLMDTLLSFAEQQESDQGKSLAAIQVQHHLNQIQGRAMCEACHTGMNAEAIGHQNVR